MLSTLSGECKLNFSIKNSVSLSVEPPPPQQALSHGLCALSHSTADRCTLVHTCRKTPGSSHASDKPSLPDSPPGPSACVSSGRELFGEVQGVLHNTTSDTPDTISRPWTWLPCTHHTLPAPVHRCFQVPQFFSFLFGLKFLRWLHLLRTRASCGIFYCMLGSDITHCCPSACWGRTCRSCDHKVCWQGRWRRPYRSNTGNDPPAMKKGRWMPTSFLCGKKIDIMFVCLICCTSYIMCNATWNHAFVTTSLYKKRLEGLQKLNRFLVKSIFRM